MIFLVILFRKVVAHTSHFFESEVRPFNNALGRITRKEEGTGPSTNIEEKIDLKLRVILNLLQKDKAE